MPITIHGDYERASVNPAYSSVAGDGDAAVVTLAPGLQASNDVAGGEERFLEWGAQLTGVMGLRPTIKVTGFYDWPQAGGYHGAPWQSTRRCMWSVDGRVWQYFDTTRRVGNTVEMRNNAPFPVDTVFVSRGRQMSVTYAGEWLTGLAAAYPTKIRPAPSAVAHIPSSQVAQFSAQSFIAGEFAPQQAGARTIPATPFYAGELNDLSLTPAGGGPKRVAILVGGVHAGEDHACFVLAAIIQAALADTPAAQIVRREFRIPFYPKLNAPGSYGGGWRGSFTLGHSGEDDANRHFPETQTGLQIVDLPKAAMTLDRAGAAPGWAIDSHGTYGTKWSMFVDSGVPSSGAFRTQLASAFGQGIVDEGDSNPGFVSEYLRSLGFSPSVTLETGDPAPVTDAEIIAFGAAVVAALAAATAGAAPAPTPPPAPAPVTSPPPAQTPTTVTEQGSGPTRVIVCTGSALDDMPAMTIMAKVRPTRAGGLSYIMAKGPLVAGLKRFLIDNSGGAPRLTFALGSAGATYAPSASTAFGAVAYDRLQIVEGIWDGGVSANGITVAVDGVASAGERINGSGAVTRDAGEPLTLLNRADRLRPFAGDEEWSGIWNRMLTPDERVLVRQNGPQAVPAGLVLSHVGQVVAPPPPVPATSPTTISGTVAGGGTFTATLGTDGAWTVTSTIKVTPS